MECNIPEGSVIRFGGFFKEVYWTVGWCPQLASLPDGLWTELSSVLRDLRVKSMFLKELPAWLAELAELESLKICGYVALRRHPTVSLRRLRGRRI